MSSLPPTHHQGLHTITHIAAGESGVTIANELRRRMHSTEFIRDSAAYLPAQVLNRQLVIRYQENLTTQPLPENK